MDLYRVSFEVRACSLREAELAADIKVMRLIEEEGTILNSVSVKKSPKKKGVKQP
jgi:hypothetical protein